MKKFGQVQAGSKDWTIQREPRARVSVSRASLELLQAENALLHDVLDEARLYVLRGQPVGSSDSIASLAAAVARFDGWTDDPALEMHLIENLLAIAEDLEHEDPPDP